MTEPGLIDLVAFGHAIRYIRKDKGLAQWELAEKAGCSQSFVSEIERGEKGAFEETRRRLCAALEWSYEATVDMGERISRGDNPAEAARLAYSLSDPAIPVPFEAQALDDLRGFRIWSAGRQTKAMTYVHHSALAGRDPANIRAHVVGAEPRVLVLVDHADLAHDVSGLFLVQLEGGDALRQAKQFPGALLLTGLEGETEATAKPWDKIVQGRVLWYQVNLELAKGGKKM